jgi:uncharacterized membrane protein
MPILLYNLSWMTVNILLALFAVLVGFYFLQTKQTVLKVISGVLWLLFLPNTIYLFTDLMHVIHQWGIINPAYHGMLLLQYVVLEVVGIVTFILAFLPFERMLTVFKLRAKSKVVSVILFNFLIALGMVLGRVERVNSWEVFTQIEKVTSAVVHIFSSAELLGLVLLFGLVCNFSYFLFRDPISHSTARLRKNFSK